MRQDPATSFLGCITALTVTILACGPYRIGPAPEDPTPAPSERDADASYPIKAIPVEGITVTTLTGGADTGHDDGLGPLASFNNPTNVTLEPDGNLIVADFNNGLLRRVTPEGQVTTLFPYTDAFQRPFGLTYSNGLLYVETDFDPFGDFSLSTGSLWSVDPNTGSKVSLDAAIGRPRGLNALADGRIIVSDLTHNTVSFFDLKLQVLTPFILEAGHSFKGAYGVVPLSTSSLAVVDNVSNQVKEIDLGTGEVSVLVGDGTLGYVDGPGAQARFSGPKGLTIDGAGNLYLADSGNHVLREILLDGTVRTLAGTGVAGYKDGPGAQAEFYGLEGLVVTLDGKTVYAADGTGGADGLPYNRIRKIQLP